MRSYDWMERVLFEDKGNEDTPRSRPSVAESDATLDSQSTDAVNNAEEMLRQCVSSSEDDDVDATVYRREAAHSPNEDRVVQRDGDVIDALADAGNPRGDAAIVTSKRRTIQGHIQPSFVSAEFAEAQSASVLESLGAMSATERKFALTSAAGKLNYTDATGRRRRIRDNADGRPKRDYWEYPLPCVS
ncbi:hypothetical protein HPB51_007555 [Rhipicephalus microplus]|uniref:Uncharacterized protein n=1 Tax=Rhipicephalus microplus TaxID=6941 RepID=A0A9J6EYV0_RHIMP|nr:hypothetical protein HPB51_007555 [Rhipicephalus microplus]